MSEQNPNQLDCQMYKDRMYGYYPDIITNLTEFKAILDAEYPEFCQLKGERDRVLRNAWFETMEESRIVEWEQFLGIDPLENSTLDDRRESITARVYGGYKLNTESISTIVSMFTRGGAESWFEDSTIFVRIYPPPGNKQYKFENVESELKRRKPAHLDIDVRRGYATWEEIKNNFTSWQDVKDSFETWDDVRYYVAPQEGGN